jgi:CRISPR-associated endonuclease/helicase Cas3
MAQAAGRCNREGRLTDAAGLPIPGRLILFRSPTKPPLGLRLGLQTTDTLRNSGNPLDLFDPATFDRYFREFFSGKHPDARDVMLHRASRDFPAVADAFQMIDDEGKVNIVVPYGDFASRVADYLHDPCRRTLRGLQPYLVGVSPQQLAAFQKSRLIETLHDQVHVLKATGLQYSLVFGLILDDVVPADPLSLISP